MKSVVKKIFNYLFILSVLGVAVGTTLGYMGTYYYVFELASHFKLHLLLTGVILIPFVLYTKKRFLIVLTLLTFAVNVYEVAPWYIKPVHAAEHVGEGFTLVSANVKFNSENKNGLLSYIQTVAPDIVFLQELDPKWSEVINTLKETYHYSFIVDYGDEFGIGILSKFPLGNLYEINVMPFHSPSLEAIATLDDGTRIKLITIHPMPPISKELFEHRNAMFEEVALRIKNSTEDVLLAGDFNTTMWSPQYKKLVSEAGLRNLSKGFGLHGTWPIGRANYTNFLNAKEGGKSGTDFIPSWLVYNHPIKLPIDHVLVRGNIIVKNISAGPDIGSDHLPIMAELQIPTK